MQEERDWGPFSVSLPGQYFSRLLLLLIVAVHTKKCLVSAQACTFGWREVLNPGAGSTAGMADAGDSLLQSPRLTVSRHPQETLLHRT